MLAVPNHFEGGEGTRRALDAGLTAEAGIVCEPTDLDICAAQRGILYMDITIKGVGAHTTYEDGRRQRDRADRSRSSRR